MRVNVIVWDNGFGLTRHLRLLGGALTAAGHQVHVSALRRGKLRKILRPWKLRARIAWQRLRGGDPRRRYDLNIMIEHVRPEYAAIARHNVLLPHPEWFLDSDRAALPIIDHVFAQTQHALTLFGQLGCRVTYTGFTSEDRRDPAVPRERAFFHLAGRSQNKGTERLLALWRRHPEWPRLTVVQNPRTALPGAAAANIDHRVDYLDDAELQRLQNAHVFHLCPSETEGFGHYIVEAMGLGALVITLDAPPMHDLVTPERGLLVAAGRTGTQNLATTYFFDEASMEAAVARALALDEATIARLGVAARSWFESNDAAFRIRLDAAVRAVAAE